MTQGRDRDSLSLYLPIAKGAQSYHGVDLAHVHLVHTRMPHHLTQHTTIPTAHNQHLSRHTQQHIRSVRQASQPPDQFCALSPNRPKPPLLSPTASQASPTPHYFRSRKGRKGNTHVPYPSTQRVLLTATPCPSLFSSRHWLSLFPGYLARVGVCEHGEVDDHLLVRHLVALRRLDHTVQHQHLHATPQRHSQH